MTDLKLVHAIQIKQFRKEENSSVDSLLPQGGQTLPGTDPIQFVSHTRDIVRPLSMPKFNIQEMMGSLERFEVLCQTNNIQTDSEMCVALMSEVPWKTIDGFDVPNGWQIQLHSKSLSLDGSTRYILVTFW